MALSCSHCGSSVSSDFNAMKYITLPQGGSFFLHGICILDLDNKGYNISSCRITDVLTFVPMNLPVPSIVPSTRSEAQTRRQSAGPGFKMPKIHACKYDGCPRAFARSYNKDEHEKTVHEGWRYFCPTNDGEKFTQATGFFRHMRNTHSEIELQSAAAYCRKLEGYP